MNWCGAGPLRAKLPNLHTQSRNTSILCCFGVHHPAVWLPRDLSSATGAAASWRKCHGQPREATTKQTLHSHQTLVLCSAADQAASHCKAALGETIAAAIWQHSAVCRIGITCASYGRHDQLSVVKKTESGHTYMTRTSACIREQKICRLDTCAGGIRIV